MMDIDKAYMLGRELMELHGLFLQGWTFSLFLSRISFGRCLYQEKRILLSKPFVLINHKSHVKDTILHEIAHALCGPRHSHDKVWEDTAKRIGCDGRRFFDTSKVNSPSKTYVGTCPACGVSVKRFRRGRKVCWDCCRKNEARRDCQAFIFKWSKIKV